MSLWSTALLRRTWCVHPPPGRCPRKCQQVQPRPRSHGGPMPPRTYRPWTAPLIPNQLRPKEKGRMAGLAPNLVYPDDPRSTQPQQQTCDNRRETTGVPPPPQTGESVRQIRVSSAGIRPFAPTQVDSRAGPRPGPRLHGAHRDSHNAVGRAPAEDPSSCVTGESHGHRELDGHGPPARTPAFRERAVGGTGGSLPVELQLPFGAPIPSTADSGGRQRKRRERESPQWALAAGRCRW